MLSAKQIQTAYKKLYVELREFIWPAQIVSDIAELEISVYKTFPDLTEIKNNYNKLKLSCCRYIDEEPLNEAFENFIEVVESSDQLYAKLDKRQEGAE